MDWEQLPGEVRTTIADRFGPIEHVTCMPGGLTASASVRLHTLGGDLFVKALPEGAPSAPLYQREQHVNPVLPSAVPSPRMLWGGHRAGWLVLVFQHIETTRPVDLSPRSPDVPALIETVQVLGETLTPNPGAQVPPVADNVAFLLGRADRLLADPPADLPLLDEYAAARRGLRLEALAGDTLLHADLHEGNLLTAPGRMHVIDWGLACHGAAWVEIALLIPRLILAGHTPEQAEDLAARIPVWNAAPFEAVTGLAAVWSLFREFVARYGPEHIRASRAAAAAAGRAWMAYRGSYSRIS
ncbi:phosphotransferase family protein [Microbispora siamensis]|nr:phosphotransferase [Microbispora siamensis]